MSGRTTFRVAAACCVLTGLTTTAVGQSAPWLTLEDDPNISSSACDVINVANAELVLLDTTRQLTIVTGPDITLEDTFVDVASGEVTFENGTFGFISFQEDGDGFRTLWWVSATGRAIELDESSGFPVPQVSDQFPADFGDVPCDACDFWDDQSICLSDGASDAAGDLAAALLNFCGAAGTPTLAMTFSTLVGMRVSRRRRRRSP